MTGLSFEWPWDVSCTYIGNTGLVTETLHHAIQVFCGLVLGNSLNNCLPMAKQPIEKIDYGGTDPQKLPTGEIAKTISTTYGENLFMPTAKRASRERFLL